MNKWPVTPPWTRQLPRRHELVTLVELRTLRACPAEMERGNFRAENDD